MQPFKLSHQSEFENWAEHKLSLYSDDRLRAMLKPLEIAADGTITANQLSELKSRIEDYNFTLFSVSNPDCFNVDSIKTISDKIGLKQLDAHLCANEDLISTITDTNHISGDQRRTYIPYSNKALSWHTDGYYNPFHQRVQAFLLYCQHAANSGGENSFIDPEIIYLLLRRESPAFIEALCEEDVMRIPENVQDQTCIRAETASSVFQVSSDYSHIDMRFSQRKRHIIWRDDALTRQALEYLNELLNSDSIWRINYRLQDGEGVISNNVLHCRSAYEDNTEPRVYIRARYYNRISPVLN